MPYQNKHKHHCIISQRIYIQRIKKQMSKHDLRAGYKSKNGAEMVLCEINRSQTCACTSASLKRMNQLTEKRPEFWRVKVLLLLSQISRRDGLRRESWGDKMRKEAILTHKTVFTIPRRARKSKCLLWMSEPTARHKVTHSHLPRKTLPELQREFCLLPPPI